MSNRITDEMKDNIVKLYTETDAGITVIRSVLGIGKGTFYKVLKERGVETGKAYKAADVETAIHMYKSGETVKKIAEETGISNRRLYKEIEERKIPKREKRVTARHSDFIERTKIQQEYIIEHYKSGENCVEIAKALCMDYATIKSVVLDAARKGVLSAVRDCDIKLAEERRKAQVLAYVYIHMKDEDKPSPKELAEMFQIDVRRLHYAIGKEKVAKK